MTRIRHASTIKASSMRTRTSTRRKVRMDGCEMGDGFRGVDRNVSKQRPVLSRTPAGFYTARKKDTINSGFYASGDFRCRWCISRVKGHVDVTKGLHDDSRN